MCLKGIIGFINKWIKIVKKISELWGENHSTPTFKKTPDTFATCELCNGNPRLQWASKLKPSAIQFDKPQPGKPVAS